MTSPQERRSPLPFDEWKSQRLRQLARERKQRREQEEVQREHEQSLQRERSVKMRSSRERWQADRARHEEEMRKALVVFRAYREKKIAHERDVERAAVEREVRRAERRQELRQRSEHSRADLARPSHVVDSLLTDRAHSSIARLLAEESLLALQSSPSNVLRTDQSVACAALCEY